MALVNPNIAMSFRQPEFTPRNAMAEYAQMQQIQGGQQAQELARFQLGAAQRAEATQNVLADAYGQSIDPITGTINYNKLTGLLAKGGGGAQIPGIEKTRRETEAAALTAKKTQGEIDKNTFELGDKKLKSAWDAIGSSTSPQSAIAQLNNGVKNGVFKAEEVAEDIQELGSMTDPTQFLKYRANAVMKLLEAKDKFASLTPNIARQDTGGAITPIQNNPMLPGYGEPVKGMTPITKTVTPGDVLSAETARTGQGITLRGQDLQDARERERIRLQGQSVGLEGRRVKVLEENQRRDADPAFQQMMTRAKATGEAIAKGDVAAQRALPGAIARAEESVRLIDELVGKQEVRDKSGKVIQAATAPHPGFGYAVGAGLPFRFVPGTSESDFQVRFDQIKGASFLEAFEALKGGGAITETEGTKATTAINRMSLAQSEKEFLAAARDLQEVVRKGVINAQAKAGGSGGATGNWSVVR